MLEPWIVCPVIFWLKTVRITDKLQKIIENIQIGQASTPNGNGYGQNVKFVNMSTWEIICSLFLDQH